MTWLQRLFHRHKWSVVLMDGNYWTECGCGAMRQLPPDALAEMPPRYPVEVRVGLADRIAASRGRR